MPASLRTHASRATSSRPYDRRSSTASPGQSENPLVHPHFARNAPPASPIQDTDADADQNPDPDVDPPDVPGLPTYAEYKRIEAGYLHSLSPRKRDKALITQAMFDKIWDVLHQPDACTIETPQFRFWVRKMFTLSRPALAWGWDEARAGTHPVPFSDPDLDSDTDDDSRADLELERSMGIGVGRESADLVGSAVVLHENRPVAVMEQLYEVFCYCHVRAGHGGRDKTCAVIREHYSWVPKELTAQFVKACPTCAVKRSGHAHGGVGVGGMGMVAQRRVGGGGGRRGRVAPLEVGVERIPVQVGPLELGSVGWPTTGGPLDPANPEPCGVREREREREWSCAREDVRTAGPSSPADLSPARGSRTRSVPREAPLAGRWSSIPRSLTVDAPPFHPCDMTRSLGHPFTVGNSSATRSDREPDEKRSPTRTVLPSLASALSNESLDENVNLTELAPSDAAECLLPPALRPLRLLRPVPSDSESEHAASYPFQIDPVLLSFNYPGLGAGIMMFPESEADAIPLALGPTCLPSEAHHDGHRGVMTRHRNVPGLCCLRAASDVDIESPSMYSMNMPALEPSRESDSPDSSFERAASYTTESGAAATLPFSLSAEFMAQNRCGRYGYRDAPLGMFYQSSCSADEVGRQLDGPLSFSIMTDT